MTRFFADFPDLLEGLFLELFLDDFEKGELKVFTQSESSLVAPRTSRDADIDFDDLEEVESLEVDEEDDVLLDFLALALAALDPISRPSPI
mmetsp:Transcript_16477/g.21137  ORF Transcript_16477/g.21137 Transcript_16477/m.21137 type:complete len:91 (-) Transcript_16477:233-505(-)